MSTASLRQDHVLIDKVVKSMETTIELLKSGKTIPEPILSQVVDFTTNFIDVCHHSKEEESLFPALADTGMPTKMGPIAVMLMEHEKSREIAKRITTSMKLYLESNDPSKLILDMEEYASHMNEHLWKENNRLFMMADMRLQNVSSQVDQKLHQIEDAKLKQTGKDRNHYEKIASDLVEYTSGS